MHYNITIEKELTIPSWTKDRDDWELYIMIRDIELPFIPFSGLVLLDIWRQKEIVHTVEYYMDDNIIRAIVCKDNSLNEFIKKEELSDNEKIQKAMDELLVYYETEGWESE